MWRGGVVGWGMYLQQIIQALILLQKTGKVTGTIDELSITIDRIKLKRGTKMLTIPLASTT